MTQPAETAPASAPARAVPVVLVPGLTCSAAIFAGQIAPLWRFGPVTVADHTRGEDIPAIARRILELAPPRFALAGFSLGGYIAFEILRQARDRVVGLALIDTSARPDSPAQTALRRQRMAQVQVGGFEEALEQQFPLLVHGARRGDRAVYDAWRAMAVETGPEVFVRQQHAIIARADSRADLATIRLPTLVLVGDADRITPPDAAEEMAAGIETARLVTVPECGHLAPIERPGAVSRALVEWAREVAANQA